jgi:hypothetical protein
MKQGFIIYTCDTAACDGKNFVPETTVSKCYNEWNEIDPAIVAVMKEKGKDVVCKLQSVIKNESFSKRLWGEYFLGQVYLDFDRLSLDECVFFFLTLEDNMALKAPGIHKVIKGHFDL